MSWGKRFKLVPNVIGKSEPEPVTSPTHMVPIPKEMLEEFIRRVAPWFRIYKFTKKMIKALEDGYLYGGWLWINIPPRFGKTVLLQLFTAWAMSADGLIDTGFLSSGQRLANKSCKGARDFYIKAGCELDPSFKSKVEWQTTSGGMMWAAGPSGQVRGSGYHIGIIDDLHKSVRELFSAIKVEAFKDFWDDEWLNRGHIHTHRPLLRIVVGQRLASNDIFGHIVDKAAEADDGGKWTCLVLDAIHSKEPLRPTGDEDGQFFIPKDAKLLDDWREEGENIEPLVLSDQRISDNRAKQSAWDAQFQQRPQILSGKVINYKWFKVIDRAAVEVAGIKFRIAVGGVDLATSTKESADYTVAFPMLLGINGLYYVFRPYMERKPSPDIRREVGAHLRPYGVSIIGVDDTAYQTSFVQELSVDPLYAGIAIKGVAKGREKTDKLLLAYSWAPIVEQGLVILVNDETDWVNRIFFPVVKKFPNVDHDDLIDGLGYAFRAMAHASPSLSNEMAVA